MNIFSYVVEHDLGFAPNPFHTVCTLACCKPKIRKSAALGDYVLGTGAAKPNLQANLIYWMRVDEILTFDQYWNDRRFRRKKPVMGGTTHLRYGDNIYHHNGNGEYCQEDSFHSREDGSVSLGDLQRDTGTSDKVLVGREFAYWGRRGIKLPQDLKFLIKKGPSHKKKFTAEQIAKFMDWLAAQQPERGYIDEPAHWQFLNS